MVTPVFLHFEGLEAPVDLGGSTELVELLQTICPGWPFELRDQCVASPFFQAIPDGDRFLAGVPGGKMKHVDGVNAICDIVAALPDDVGFLSDCLLCLHAAAIRIGDGLVLFPNTKKAGKSTLSIALAELGLPLFTDDFIRIRKGDAGRPLGIANGIRPRLRLPPPAGLGELSGPSNGQYQYPQVAELPGNGVSAPLSALVFLDRREGETARLEEVSADDAMRGMLFQNFGRHLHSGTTLAALATLVEGLRLLRLTYDAPNDAAWVLREAMAGLPVPDLSFDAVLDQTILADLPELAPRWQAGARARQVLGVTERRIGEATYVADPEGRAIKRLDPLASAVWEMLAVPFAASDLNEVLAGAFPDTPRERIADDVARLLRDMAAAGLIEAA
jgi:hypothetical protein